MTDPRLAYEKRRYVAIREKLLVDDPAIDEQTLADTVEGVTDLNELLAAILRGALNDKARIVGIETRIAEMANLAERLAHRAERRRKIVRDAMAEAGIDKVTAPDFSASVRLGQPHVVPTDEFQIPGDYWETRRHLNKQKLLDDLKAGVAIPGASLSNPAPVLTVRTK